MESLKSFGAILGILSALWTFYSINGTEQQFISKVTLHLLTVGVDGGSATVSLRNNADQPIMDPVATIVTQQAGSTAETSRSFPPVPPNVTRQWVLNGSQRRGCVSPEFADVERDYVPTSSSLEEIDSHAGWGLSFMQHCRA